MTMDLAPIIQLRERKLSDRERDEKNALARCDSARRTYALAQQRIEAFADQIRTLELDLLRELLDTQITIHDIDALHERLKEAEQTAHRLANAANLAKIELAGAEKRATTARETKQNASAALNKINCFNDELAKEKAILAAAAEDAEIEDFVETMFARG